MSFMRPAAEYMGEREIEELRKVNPDRFDDESMTGWYGRLSAPGYLDCTEWDGPYRTEAGALAAVMDMYGVDENGDAWEQGDPHDEARGIALDERIEELRAIEEGLIEGTLD